MFHKFMDDVLERIGKAMQLTSLAAAVGICLFITAAFLCAAAFVSVLQTYGLLQACLAGAGVFFLAALLAGICYAVIKGQTKKKPVEAAKPAKSAMQSALSDPMVMAAGLQIIRTIGLKRIIPLVAIGGVALGLIASRRSTDDNTTEEAEAAE